MGDSVSGAGAGVNNLVTRYVYTDHERVSVARRAIKF